MISAHADLDSYAKLKELGVSIKLLDSLSPAQLKQLLALVTALLERHKDRTGSKLGNHALEGGVGAGLATLPLLIWIASQKSDMLPVVANYILI